MIEKTLILLKPDAVQRCFCGEIISRFERAGLKIIGMKMVWVSKEQSKEHYKSHLEKPFYPGLEKFITQGPVLAMVLEGIDTVEIVRKLVGSTIPKEAQPGTIRGDYAHMSMQHANEKGKCVPNLIHASGNKEEAEYEINLWFTKKELHTYKTVHDVQTILGDD
ncbi:nucleoside-diphosphate kinase [Candidatus Woesearchaeota archaeon CG10_big_fil_rev_8_21_14_0_10_30_7]|nr:MAG: nucleoside-diphosphate kinase [Candidatus Woesearchaeota archaeon CG10_big_fil_rev_8_21_14_0_10_30_7]